MWAGVMWAGVMWAGSDGKDVRCNQWGIGGTYGVDDVLQLLPNGLVHHPLPVHRVLSLELVRDDDDLDMPAVALYVADRYALGVQRCLYLGAHALHQLALNLTLL
jgi:hypothetical protein